MSKARARQLTRLMGEIKRDADELTGSPNGSGETVDVNTATWDDIAETSNRFELAGALWRVRDRFDEAGMAKAVLDAWTATPEPYDQLSRHMWVTLFRAGGFAVNGVPSNRPPGWIEVYRGAVRPNVRGLSWTPDQAWAGYHAERCSGVVVSAVVSWSAVLADIEIDERAPERELIIDPDVIATLDIEEIRGSSE